MNILITGGSTGLGAAITRTLSGDPENVVYFTYHRSEANAQQILSEFSNARAVKCNFKNGAEVSSLKDQIPEMGIDVLVNNVYFGEAIKTYFHKIAPDDFMTDFNENIMPAIVLTQAAIHHFRKKKKGKIITILTSFLVNTPPTGSAVYVANKAYLHELTKVWAVENVKYNIASNCISPSFMQTDFTKDVDDRIIEQMKAGHPLQKLLTPEEVAESVLFLTRATAQVNGLNLIINAASDIT